MWVWVVICASHQTESGQHKGTVNTVLHSGDARHNICTIAGEEHMNGTIMRFISSACSG